MSDRVGLTSDMARFLRARLDDDAAYIQSGTCNCWQPTDNGKCDNLPDCPARLLAEIDAKRRLIEEVWDREENLPSERHPGNTAEAVLKILALPYADHDEYRDEWRP